MSTQVIRLYKIVINRFVLKDYEIYWMVKTPPSGLDPSGASETLNILLSFLLPNTVKVKLKY